MNIAPRNHEIGLDLAGIQTAGFDILCATQAYCARHGLHLYLCGGTLLGAVRHGGFIPWDDDVDVFLSRPEFEKLKQLVKKEPIRNDLKLACRENGGLMRPIIRIYNTDTTVRRNHMQTRSMPHLWLDILPVDGMPTDPSAVLRVYRRRFLLNLMNNLALRNPMAVPKSPADLIKPFLMPAAALFGAGYWSDRIDRLARRRDFNTSETVGCVAFGLYGIGEMMSRSEYIKPVPVTFEGRPFKTMSCWQSYLTGIYGDYMRLPPPEKRVPPHDKYASIRPEALERIISEHRDVYNARQKATHF